LTKVFLVLGKLLIGSVSFRGGFFGAMFGLIMLGWAIIDILTLLES
jgi:hypothetical protein